MGLCVLPTPSSPVALALVHQPSHRSLRGALHDAMPQIQQMFPRSARRIDAPSHLGPYLVLRPEQNPRIYVAADGNVRPQYLAGGGEIHRPIQRNHIGAHVPLHLEIRRSSVGEVDDGHVRMRLLDDANGLLRGGLGEPGEIVGGELVGPALEDLDDLRAALDLVHAVGADHGGEAVEKFGEGSAVGGRGQHHFFGPKAVLGGAALYGVGGQGEGGSHEAHEGAFSLRVRA
mmetsp:Transcript_34598/g.79986  ORF Transcript_34598/g.79986 Transcript_34598/m.79986 type:complete len:231 (+) Transcript_34598:109-801(+)